MHLYDHNARNRPVNTTGGTKNDGKVMLRLALCMDPRLVACEIGRSVAKVDECGHRVEAWSVLVLILVLAQIARHLQGQCRAAYIHTIF